MIHESFNEVEGAPADQHPADQRPALVAQGQSVVRRQRIQMPTATGIQVAAWKRPSQSVFVSIPATVVARWSPWSLSMWCHWKI